MCASNLKELGRKKIFSRLNGRVIGGPSILSANFANLAADIDRAKAGGAELVHFDVMDNHFVPNLTVGPAVAASIVQATNLPIDANLQVYNPQTLIPALLNAGVASISVQFEAVTHLHRILSMIREGGAEAGIAINPTTSPRSLEWALPYADYVLVMTVNPGFGGQRFIPEMKQKVQHIREMTDLPIEVDGGITPDTAPLMVEAGAQVLVSGSAVYDNGDPAENMRRIIKAGRNAAAVARSSMTDPHSLCQ